VGLAEVVAIRSNAEQDSYERLQDPNWMELWTGGANLGWAGAAGNAQTQTFTFAANAARQTMTDRTSLYFNSVRASALLNGAKTSTARAVRGGWSYNRDIRPRVFLSLFNDYEYDRFQSLDLRFVLGAGAGYHAVDNERTRLDLLAGGAYNRERFSTPLTRHSAEFYWGDEFNHKLNSIITLFQAYRMFNSLTDTPDFRVNFDFGANMRLAQWLTWNVSVSDRYLRNPAVGRLRNDVLYSTGLGVTFGRQ
jgi:putative salt-induced outer membrane protein YdiY